MNMRLKLFASVFLFILATSHSNSYAINDKIYKTVHADGSVSYSDQPSEGAVEIDIGGNALTIQGLKSPPITPPKILKQTTDYKLTILSPAKDATIRNNLGEINIAAQLEPSLAGTFELVINGTAYQSVTGIFRLSNMDRGSYQYLIHFIDNSGKVIASSQTSTLHLHKASVLIN